MSKNTGMGRKRTATKLNKGMDKCDGKAHSKQCGKGKYITKSESFLDKK